MSNTNEKPSLTKDGLTFFPVPEFGRPQQVFGANSSQYFSRRSLPDVPRKYEDMAEAIFFNGGQMPDIQPQVDIGKAVAATKAWLSSWSPAHEAKIATVAYAFWVWCEGDLTSAKEL